MQEYATAKLNYTDEISANKVMQMVQAFLKNYEYEEPEKCSWIDYLNVKNNSVIVESDAMCGWLDYMNLFKQMCEKISEEFPKEYFDGESEYVNISSGFKYYMSVIFNENGLIIKESTICCEYCGCPIFSDEIMFMRNVDDERVVALCSEDCKTRFFEEECDEDEEWAEATREDYEAENGF